MKFCRFGGGRVGVVTDEGVRDVSRALEILPVGRYPLPSHDLLIANLDAVRARAEQMTDAELIAVDVSAMLSPVANPGKIVAAPVNYRAHLEEAIADEATFSRAHVRKIQETGLFLKATSSLVGPNEAIRLAHPNRRTDHEIELVAIISKPCRNVSAANALDYVAGYAIGLDITIRGPEERSLRKSLDTYSVLGPWFVTADEFGDPSGKKMELSVDAELRQRANTRDLIMSVPDLIEFASSYYTLHPGDLLYTGTPEGVGPILPGNRINVTIEGIGAMSIGVITA